MEVTHPKDLENAWAKARNHSKPWHGTFEDCSYLRCGIGLKTNIGKQHWGCCFQTDYNAECTKTPRKKKNTNKEEHLIEKEDIKEKASKRDVLVSSSSSIIADSLNEDSLNSYEKAFIEFYQSTSWERKRSGKRFIPILFSKNYNMGFFGIDKLHPFDLQKYQNVFNGLLRASDLTSLGLAARHFVKVNPPSNDVLKMVHTDDYLNSLNDRTVVAGIAEVIVLAALPMFIIRSQLLNPALCATGGSVLACKLALERGWGINLGGGYHHCSGNEGGGFCIYADISLAIQYMRAHNTSFRRVFIVDLDAHQGNGHERDFMDDEDVVIMDVYNEEIYPGDTYAKRGIDIDVPLKSFTADDEYLRLVKTNLEGALEAFSPFDMLLYNAGTDCMAEDPLGSLSVSPEGIIKRDEIVFRAALKRGIPIMMVLSGGYQKSNAEVITRSIINLEHQFGLISSALEGRGAGVLRSSISSEAYVSDEEGDNDDDEEEEEEEENEELETQVKRICPVCTCHNYFDLPSCHLCNCKFTGEEKWIIPGDVQKEM